VHPNAVAVLFVRNTSLRRLWIANRVMDSNEYTFAFNVLRVCSRIAWCPLIES
jgi:hypothetical protein